MLEQAIGQVHKWRESTGADFPRSSVNVSARQVQQPSFADEIAELLCRHDPSARLTLEITETLMMQDAELTIARLQAVRSPAGRSRSTTSGPAGRRCPGCVSCLSTR